MAYMYKLRVAQSQYAVLQFLLRVAWLSVSYKHLKPANPSLVFLLLPRTKT